jgi:hypothetical protein
VEGKYLKKNIVILIGIILMSAGIILTVRSYFEPNVITPTDWNNQINQAEDVNPPLAERFQHFDPGDIVYIEGRVSSIESVPNSSRKLIRVTDDTQSCAFILTKNFTQINSDDHVFLKVKIIGYEPSDNSFILSGNETDYFGEQAVLIDVVKDYFSFKAIYFFGGVFSFILGSIIIYYFLKIKNKGHDIQKENYSLDKEE